VTYRTRFLSGAGEIVILDRSSELAHREITAPSIDLVVEVPVAIHVGLEDVAAQDVLHNP
jgi:hypothetical protein